MIRNNIKKLRRSRNLSQRVLGEALGVRQGIISDWEMGKVQPTEENVEDLASFFDVSPAYVLGKAPERSLMRKLPRKNIMRKILMNAICWKYTGFFQKTGKIIC